MKGRSFDFIAREKFLDKIYASGSSDIREIFKIANRSGLSEKDEKKVFDERLLILNRINKIDSGLKAKDNFLSLFVGSLSHFWGIAEKKNA